MESAAATTPGDGCAAGVPGGLLRRWIESHDERWLFIVSYVGLAVVLSIWISVFWLAVVVAAHFALELVRQSGSARTWSATFGRAMWETKLDVSLVLFALALGVYMEFVLGIAGLGPAARLGAQSAARAAGWMRTLRAVLLSLDDVAQVGRAVAARSAVSDDDGPAVHHDGRGDAPDVCVRRRLRWSVGDHIGIWLGAVCCVLILTAPLLTDHTLPSVVGVLLEELHPWPHRADD